MADSSWDLILEIKSLFVEGTVTAGRNIPLVRPNLNLKLE